MTVGSDNYITVTGSPAVRDRLLVIGLLAPSIALGCSLWTVGDVTAVTAAGLLVDRFVQFAPLLVAIALICTFSGRPKYSVCALLFAAVLAGILSSILLIAWLTAVARGVAQPWIGVWSFAAFLGAVAALVVGVRYLASSVPDRLPPLTMAVVLAVVAGVLPVVELWNSAMFLPSQTEAALSQTAEVTYEGKRGEQSLLALTYEAKNDTGTRMFVIISRIYICSYETARQIDAATEPADDPACESSQFTPVSPQSWISAKSSLTFRRTFEAAVSRPVVHVRARIVYARGDRVRISTESSPTSYKDGECDSLTPMRISETSRYEARLHKPVFLTYYSRAGGRVGYGIFAAGGERHCPARGDETLGARNNRLAKYYGVTEATVIWEGHPSLTAADQKQTSSTPR